MMMDWVSLLPAPPVVTVAGSHRGERVVAELAQQVALRTILRASDRRRACRLCDPSP
jgi:hypothetical protein